MTSEFWNLSADNVVIPKSFLKLETHSHSALLSPFHMVLNPVTEIWLVLEACRYSAFDQVHDCCSSSPSSLHQSWRWLFGYQAGFLPFIMFVNISRSQCYPFFQVFYVNSVNKCSVNDGCFEGTTFCLCRWLCCVSGPSDCAYFHSLLETAKVGGVGSVGLFWGLTCIPPALFSFSSLASP